MDGVKYIHSLDKFGSVLGLDNIRCLLKILGNPEKKLKFIHVAGTNGKGSVSSYIGEVLKEAGYKVGLYISPYVDEFNERISINGIYISFKEIDKYAAIVKKAADIMVAEGRQHPTEFEVITAIGLLYFYDKKVDVAILEVGLGGRLDATNVIDAPIVSVITRIGFDHMEYLGETLSEIAYEKCGIIKGCNGGTNGAPVVTYLPQEDEAMAVIKEVCENKGAKLYIADQPDDIDVTLHKTSFVLNRERYVSGLIGEFQAYNASLAVKAFDVIGKHFNVSDSDIKEGIKKAKWKGRMEVLSENPLLIIDGAHNLDGIKNLKNSLDIIKEKIDGKSKLVLIMGMLKDKEYEKCVKHIAPLADFFISVPVPNPRSADRKVLYDIAKGFTEAMMMESAASAVLYAVNNHKDSIICCCGSLFMLGDIRKLSKSL